MEKTLQEKERELYRFLQQYRKVAVAFSGGVDSSVVLAACKAAGVAAEAIFADSQAVPQFEKEDAARVAGEVGADLRKFSYRPLDNPRFCANRSDRCYHCKKSLMQALKQLAFELGCEVVFDGANWDDQGDYRPGMQAAQEEGIVSPLLACSVTKAEVRLLAQKYHLSVAGKPAYACLASRVAYGEEITEAKLQMIEKAEAAVSALGFTDVRVRCHGNLARLEVDQEQIELAATVYREKLLECIKRAGFLYVALDLQGYRTGSMNSALAHDASL